MSYKASLCLVFALGASLVANDAKAGYIQANLVASNPGYGAIITDPEFINAWGLALRPAGAGGHWWVANTDTNRVTEYIGDSPSVPFGQDALQVTPVPANALGDGSGPTGQVYSGSMTDFLVSGLSFTGVPITSVPARFIVAGEGGTIAAWGEAGSTLATRMSSFVTVVNNTATGAVYKGIGISADSGSGNRLYAANFASGKIEVYDADWNAVAISPTAFTDTTGTIPPGYAPFNIQRVFNPSRGADSLFVAFAKVANAAAGEEETGPGLGFLAEFDLDGNLLGVWDAGGKLNAPWGIAAAPMTGFGPFSGTLLVGNFGDGTIMSFDFASQDFLGYVGDPANPLSIDGLWDLKVGNGVALGRSDSLYFTAGPAEETEGLFGRISYSQVPEPPALSLLAVALAAAAGLVSCQSRFRHHN